MAGCKQGGRPLRPESRATAAQRRVGDGGTPSTTALKFVTELQYKHMAAHHVSSLTTCKSNRVASS